MVDKHIGFDLVVDEFKVRCSKQFEVFEFDPTLATTLHLTVVEWKDCHFLAVATVSDLQNSYCNQWTHPYEPQISNRFVFSAICLHFTAVLVKFSEKTSAIKTKSPQTKWPYQGV